MPRLGAVALTEFATPVACFCLLLSPAAHNAIGLCIFVSGFADEAGLEPTVLVSDPSTLTSKSGAT